MLTVFIITHIYNVIRKAIISLQVVLLALKSSISTEVSACPWGPKAVLFHLAKFLLEALRTLAGVPQNVIYMHGTI
jgi:hypothetical protein